MAVVDAFYLADDLRLIENELNYMESRLQFWSYRLATYKNRPGAPRMRREVLLGRTNAVLHQLADLVVQIRRIPVWQEMIHGGENEQSHWGPAYLNGNGS